MRIRILEPGEFQISFSSPFRAGVDYPFPGGRSAVENWGCGVGWYLKALWQDKRFKIAAGAAAGSFAAIVLAMLTGVRWLASVAAYGLFPIFMVSLVAIFVVFGIVVRHDYLDRKGR